MTAVRVLFINPTAQLGGAEYSLLDLAGTLDRERFSPMIACLGDGPLVTPADLPDLAPRDDDPSAVDELTKAIERFEKRHIERLLRQTADKREAAKRLGIGLSSLYRKIEQYGIGGE